MANTVNDVMNVIASPDFGIKNIAGTNQEILAILGGYHQSKNNIHAIVDDIRSILQKMLDSAPKKKPIDMDGNLAKVNHKHIKNILNETQNVVKAINDLGEKIETQGGIGAANIAKLSDKASDKIAEAMSKNIEKQNKGGGLSSIVNAFRKLKDISLKDIFFGKKKLKMISEIFKNAEEKLSIDDKNLGVIIKLINSTPDMMKKILKAGRRANRIIKNNIIDKLSDILVGKNSMLAISNTLQKHKKTFEKSSKTAKNIEELARSLNTAMRKIVFAALWSKLANIGIASISLVVGEIVPLSKKLEKNSKNFKNGADAAKRITTLVGNLLISSIFLTMAIITGIPAVIGALVLSLMVKVVIPVVKTLSKNKKNIGNGVKAALGLVTFTGIMTLTTLLLTIVAKNGISALLGSIFVYGIVWINSKVFKMLNKQSKNILKGAVAMLVMSLSLIFFGVALNLITNATKNVTFKQVTLIALMTGILSGAVIALGIPQVFAFALLGSVALMVMSIGLILYGVALNKIGKSTENLKFKQIALVSGSIMTLGLSIAAVGPMMPLILMGSLSLMAISLALVPYLNTLSDIYNATKEMKMKDIFLVESSMLTFAGTLSAMAPLLPLITLGALSVAALNWPLKSFVNSLRIIEKMKTVPTKKVSQVLSAMKTVGNFFKKNKVKLKAIWNAAKYALIMRPFASAVYPLAALAKVGGIPGGLVSDALAAMRSIARSFKNNPVHKDAIWSAWRYHSLMSAFAGIVRIINKSKKIERIPIGSIYSALDVIDVVGRYFEENPINRKAILESYKYLLILRPFGRSLSYLSRLKKLGSIPIRLVYQTLDAINLIANYYKENPIDKDTIYQSIRYLRVLRPFGRSLSYLFKLKKLGSVPIRLVYQTLDAINSIGNYYKENPIDEKTIIESYRYLWVLRPFGRSLSYLFRLKKLGSVPIGLVYRTLDAINAIGRYYKENPIDKETIIESYKYLWLLRPFGRSLYYFRRLKNLGSIPIKLVNQTLDAMRAIADFYMTTDIDSEKSSDASKIANMVSNFGQSAQTLGELSSLKRVPVDAIKDSVLAIKWITWFYNTTRLPENIENLSALVKMSVDKFGEMGRGLDQKIGKLKPINLKPIISIIVACRNIIAYYTYTLFRLKRIKVLNMNDAIKLFSKNAKYLKGIGKDFTKSSYNSIKFMLKSMGRILYFLRFFSLNKWQRYRAERNILMLRRMTKTLRGLSQITPSNISSIGSALSNVLVGINKVDLDQVESVTNLFRAFNRINKSENIINKFTESVKEFTSTCKTLIDVMGYNTDAINNMDTSGFNIPFFGKNRNNNNSSEGTPKMSPSSQPMDVVITNLDELAKAIAEKINGTLSVDMPDTQVQLLINGTGGNEWTITKY